MGRICVLVVARPLRRCWWLIEQSQQHNHHHGCCRAGHGRAPLGPRPLSRRMVESSVERLPVPVLIPSGSHPLRARLLDTREGREGIQKRPCQVGEKGSESSEGACATNVRGVPFPVKVPTDPVFAFFAFWFWFAALCRIPFSILYGHVNTTTQKKNN
jgi:hypothetical protein